MKPYAVLRSSDRPPSDDAIERALATIRAAIPPSLLTLFALHIEAMKRERAWGHFGAQFHLKRGDVRSIVFDRHTTHYADEKEESKP